MKVKFTCLIMKGGTHRLLFFLSHTFAETVSIGKENKADQGLRQLQVKRQAFNRETSTVNRGSLDKETE